MNVQDEWNELTDDDRVLLEMVESALTRKETGASEDTSLRAFCVQLANTAPLVDVRFRERLKARLIETLKQQAMEGRPMNTRQGVPRLRWRVALGVAIMLLLLAAAIALYPPSRAWAQGILGRLGPFFFTNAPTLSELALTATPTPWPTSPTVTATGESLNMQRVQVMTAEEARALAGYAMLDPGYLPEEYESYSFEVWLSQGPQALEVDQTYGNGPDVLIIRQIYLPDGGNGVSEFPVGDAVVEEVTVRGQPGVWVEETNLGQHQNEDGTAVLTKWSMLMWQEGDFLFWIYTNALSKEEALKVAESLSEEQ